MQKDALNYAIYKYDDQMQFMKFISGYNAFTCKF